MCLLSLKNHLQKHLVWHIVCARNQLVLSTCNNNYCCSTVCFQIGGTIQQRICIDRLLDSYWTKIISNTERNYCLQVELHVFQFMRSRELRDFANLAHSKWFSYLHSLAHLVLPVYLWEMRHVSFLSRLISLLARQVSRRQMRHVLQDSGNLLLSGTVTVVLEIKTWEN